MSDEVISALSDILADVEEQSDAKRRPDYARAALSAASVVGPAGPIRGDAFARPAKKGNSAAAEAEHVPSAFHSRPRAIGPRATGAPHIVPRSLRFDEASEHLQSLGIAPVALEFQSQTPDLDIKLAGILAGPDSELLKRFPEADRKQLTTGEREDFPELAEAITKFRRVRSRRKWEDENPENAVDRKRTWRAANGEKNRQDVRDWKRRNPDRLAAQKGRAAERAYHKPFIAIDTEGGDVAGGDVKYNGVNWPSHRIFLAGAGGWKRTRDPIELAAITDPKERAEAMREGQALPFEWLGRKDKRPLTTQEAFDWLLLLPEKFGDAVFVMFAFNYDVTQFLIDLPRRTAWEIAKRETFPDATKGERRGRPIREAPTFWRNYAIKYLKSKKFELWRLRDPDRPWKTTLDANGRPMIDKATGRPRRELDASEHIVIYDAFGFYQEPFVKAVESLVLNHYMSEGELKTIAAQKANRANFAETDFQTIKHYCGLELVGLSKALTVLRDGFDKMGLRLRAWSGAGSAASASFRKEGLHKEHFPDDIGTADIPPWQDAAFHAYFGGNIQLMKQGYEPRCGDDVRLYGYDIASAYPSACLELPSMRGGTWSHVKDLMEVNRDGLQRLKDIAAHSNVLSMFLVQWAFPIASKPAYDRKSKAYGPTIPFPFFPLPYRMQNGAILFPAEGTTWVMRDELIGALQWIETFFPTKAERNQIPFFLIREQWQFAPANDEMPFAFVQKLYEMRAATPKADTLNKAIKLVINSLYGKTAQSIGGAVGKPPATACPYYAAAITANCRMRLMLAALRAPHDIVMFATDGIVSTKPLEGLARVRDMDRKDPVKDKVELGDWEMNRLCGGFFLQSGVYLLFAPGEKVKSKTRGINPRELLMTMTMEQFLIGRTLPQWRKPIEPDDPSTYPRLEVRRREFITIGSAVVSPQRYAVRGRWAETSRFVDIHNLGVKRELIDEFAPFYISRGGRDWRVSERELSAFAAIIGKPVELIRDTFEAGEAFRCRMPVPTMPARNPTPGVLSAPRMPDWIDQETGDDLSSEMEQLEIAQSQAA